MEDQYEDTAAEVQEEPVQWPVQGAVTAQFSQDTLTYSQTMADWRTHEGLDIAAETGADVTAAQSGTVTAVYQDDLLGNVVVVSHSGDLATRYANLSSTAVSEGDTVAAGDLLGQVGTSALLEVAEPSHLHFEVFSQGLAEDPLSYLPE
jgi:murein DD-endopeptidase MepM/ murein hydrolase activator NlpD